MTHPSPNQIRTLTKRVRKVLNSITKRFSNNFSIGGYDTDSVSEIEEEQENKILVCEALKHFCCFLRQTIQVILGTEIIELDEYTQFTEPHLYEEYIDGTLNYIDNTLDTNYIDILVLEEIRNNLDMSINELIGKVSIIMEADRIKRRIDEIEECSFWTLAFLGLIVVFGTMITTLFFQK